MKCSRRAFSIAGLLLSAMALMASGEDTKDEAIKKDRKQLEGSWVATSLEVDGNKAMDEDAKKITLIIGADGSWNLNADGKEVSQGTTSIDPSKPPKTIDFTVTSGNDKGEQSLGIYEFGDNTVKFCVSKSGKERPGEFSSPSGSATILISFERMKTT